MAFNRDLQALIEEERKRSKSLLTRFAETLDTPGRYVRSALTGVKDATGYDVIEKFGIKNKEGEFDFADIAAFGSEVLLDPLLLIGGPGKTLAGKVAQRATKLRAAEKAGIDMGTRLRKLQDTAKSSKLITPGGLSDEVAEAQLKQARLNVEQAKTALGKNTPGNVPGDKLIRKNPELARAEYLTTMEERAKVGQQALLRFHVPGTRIDVPLIKGAPVFKGLGKLGSKLTDRTTSLGKVGHTASKIFNAQYGLTKAPYDRAVIESADDMARVTRDIYAEHARVGLERVATISQEKGHTLEKSVDEIVRSVEQGGFIDVYETFEQFAKKQMGKGKGTDHRLVALRETYKYLNGTVDPAYREISQQLSKDLAENWNRQNLAGVATKGFQQMTVGQLNDIAQKDLSSRLELLFVRNEIPKKWYDKGVDGMKGYIAKRVGLTISDDDARLLYKKAVLNNKRVPVQDVADVATRYLPPDITDEAMNAMLEGNFLGFFPRVLHPDAIRLAQHNPDLFKQLKSYMMSDASRNLRGKYTASGQMSIEEVLKGYKTGAIRFFSELPDDLRPRQWFISDPIQATTVNHLRGDLNILKGVMANVLIDNSPLVSSKHVDEIFDVAKEGMPAGEFASSSGINTLSRRVNGEFKRVHLTGDKITDRRLVQDMFGMNRLVASETADEVTKTWARIENPEELERLSRVWGDLTGMIKGSLTVLFPGFHARNLLSDGILSFLQGGMTNGSALAKAFKVAIGKDDEALRLLEHHGLVRGGKVAEIGRAVSGKTFDVVDPQLKLLEDVGIEFQKRPGLMGKLQRGGEAFVKTRYAQFSERFSRAQHFFAMKAQGLTDLEAATATRKALLDYSNITESEKRIGNFVLFYNWVRQSTPLLFSYLARNDPKFNILMRSTGLPTADRSKPLPAYLEETSAIPIGDTGQYITGLGAPTEEFNRWNFFNREGQLGFASIFRRIGLQINPLIRGPAELAFNKDLFQNKALSEIDRAGPETLGLEALGLVERQELPSGESRPRVDPYVGWIMRQAPFGRGLRTAGQIADVIGEGFGKDLDPNRGAGQQAAQVLTGVRFANVDAIDRIQAEQSSIKSALLDKIRQGRVGKLELLFPRGPGRKDKTIKAALERFSELAEEKKKITGKRR